MFSWLKKKSAASDSDNPRAKVQAAIDASIALGGILEDNPGVLVMDTAMLPLSKPEMKVALRIAWKVAPNPELQNAIEICYLGLSNFQEFVGGIPINMALAESDDPSLIASRLEDILPWMNQTAAEMEILKAEFESFKRGAVV